jgi:hypothetical protein
MTSNCRQWKAVNESAFGKIRQAPWLRLKSGASAAARKAFGACGA